MNKKGIIKSFYSLSVCFLILLGFISCEIGLGASVDTQAPSVTIEYPGPSDVVMENFIFAGNCSDDGKIASVEISVKNNTTNTSYGTYYAQLNEDGTKWQVELNKKENPGDNWPFLDGKYSFEVVAKDASGKSSGIASRTLEIDNTPPVVILSKPLSLGTANLSDLSKITSYGRSLKIGGETNDDHGISKVNLYVYKTSDLVNGKITQEPVTLSIDEFYGMNSDNPLIIANYYTSSEILNNDEKTKKRENYLNVYSEGSDITSSDSYKSFYSRIEMVDEAKIFRNPGDSGVEKGNISKETYIQSDDFYDNLCKAPYKISASKLTKIFNGTDEEFNATQRADILSKLSAYTIPAEKSDKEDSQEINVTKANMFKMNPNSAPTYSLVGYGISNPTYTNPYADNGNYVSYRSGAPSFELNAGSDGYPIKGSSVKVILKDLTDPSKTNIEVLSNTDSDTRVSNTIKFSDFAIENGHEYKIEVVGEDREGNSIVPEGGHEYGFIVQTAANPPVTVITEPDADKCFSGLEAQTVTLGGKITTTGVPLTTLDYTLNVIDVKTQQAVVVTPSVVKTNSSDFKSGENTVQVKLSDIVPSEPGKYKYLATIKGIDANGSASDKVTFYVDNKNPELSIRSITPTVKGEGDDEGKTFVNGKIKVSARASDNNELKSVDCYVLSGKTTFVDADLTASAKVNTNDLGESPEVEIDTTKYADNTPILIVFKAVDSVGNEFKYSSSDFLGGNKNYIVKQETDRPIINYNNADKNLTDLAAIKTAYIASQSDTTKLTNIFDALNNRRLTATITDDDGVKEVSVLYKKKSDLSFPAEADSHKVLKDGKSTSYSLNYTLPSDYNLYDIKIKVTDTEGTNNYHVITETFAVAVDDGAPKITVGTTSDSWYGKETVNIVTGTASDGTGLSSVSGAGSGLTITNITAPSVTANSKNANWSHKFKTGTASGNGTITYTATDVYGQTATATYTYKMDLDAPEEYNSGSYKLKLNGKVFSGNEWFNSSALSVSGYFTEDYSASGISKVEFRILPNGKTGVENEISAGNCAASKDDAANAAGSRWKYESIASGFESGAGNKLYIIATDVAGNVSTKGTGYAVKIDKTGPTIQSDSTEAVKTNGKQDKLTITGTMSDDASGVASIECYIKNASGTSQTITTTAGTYGQVSLDKENNTWSLEIDCGTGTAVNTWFSTLQPNAVFATITDNAGNKTENVKIATLDVDTTDPDLSEIDCSPLVDSSYINGTTKLFGTVNVDETMGKVEAFYKKSGAADTTYKKIGEVNGTYCYNWSINFNTKDTTTFTDLSSTQNTSIVLKVVATDKAGNTVSKTKAVTVSPDSDRPVISLDDLKVSGSMFDALKVNGTVEDDDGTITAANFFVGEKIGGASTITWYNNAANPTKVSKFSNGAFTYVLDGTVQGSHTLYFKITDAAGTTFASDSTNDLAKPKVHGATWTAASDTDKGTEVTFTLDTRDPDVLDPVVVHGNNAEEPFENNVIIGKNRDASFKIKVYAKDSSGIKSVSAQIAGETEVSVTSGTDGTGTYNGWKLYQLSMSAPTAANLAGSKDIVLTVTDNANRPKVTTKSFIFDNVSPTLSVSYPNEQVDSDVEMRGTTTDDGEGVVSIGYVVAGSDIESSWASKTTAQKDALFTTIENATASWTLDWSNGGLGLLTQFFYTTGDSNNLVYHNKKSSTDTVTYGTETASGSGVYDIPVYFRVEDKAGNVTYKTDYKVRYNPDGDRPVAKILYPENESKIGGTIRISGSATDNVSVEEVYVQIQKAGYTTGELNNSFTDVSGYSLKKADGKASWSISIDGTSTTFGAPGNASYGNNVDINARSKLRIRAKAKDNNGTEGAWTDWVTFIVDKDAPVISNLTLVQYSNNDSPDAAGNTIVKSKAYSSGTWINGKWWLNFDVEDTAGISSLYTDATWTKEGTISRSEVTVKNVSNAEEITDTEIAAQTVVSGSSKGYKGAHICLDTSGEGYVRFAINAKDNSEKKTPGSQDVYIRFDNNAPVQADPYHNGDKLGNGKIAGTTTIVQENYTYQINSTATESGSGLAYSIVYFKRPIASSSSYRVYDPRMDGSRSGTPGSYTYEDGAITSYTDTAEGIPSKKYTSVTRSAVDTFTLSTADKYLRKNSAVKINGVYRLITDVSGATYTFAPADNDKSTTVEAVYGIVVDNIKAETLNTGDGTVSSDDGDGIYDNVTDEGGGNYTWKFAVNSKNIPDGPLTVGIVSFDEAGNSSTKVETSTFVENNAPRIARVYLGTDLSGDGNFGGAGFEDEILTYSTLVESTSAAGGLEGVAAATINALTGDNAFTAKDKTLIRTEIVGGNGTMKYTWNYQTYGESDWNTSVTGTSTATAFSASTEIASTDEDALTIKTKKTASSRKDVVFNVTSDKLAGKISDGKAKINLTYWDETEEMTQGTDSLNATLSVEMNVDVVDGVAPKAVIDDFYWTDKDDNSLYENSRANGHIDLPAAVAGDDPKVSGKVTFRGSAYDDQRLTALWMTIDLANKTNKFAFTGASANGSKNSRTYYKVASYASGAWTGTDKWSASGWKFTVTPDYQNQSGHRVTWQLDLDTNKIKGVAVEDLLVRILAEDKKSTPNASSETAATSNTAHNAYNNPAYQIDVVPYITGITRADNKVNTRRSRSGATQVVAGEDIVITGFNLPGAAAQNAFNASSNKNGVFVETTANKTVFDTDGTKATSKMTAETGATNASMTVTVPGNSGYLQVMTNGVCSVNNAESTSVEYNKEESENKEDLWTSNRYLSVWKNNEYFYFSNDPISPAMDKVTYASNNKQHRLYGGWGSQGSKVYGSYAAESGSGATGNANSPANGKSGKSSNSFGDPISYFDLVTDGTNSYNLVVDCWQGNTDGWGRNFIINKNGYYSHNSCLGSGATATSSSDSAMSQVIERMGSTAFSPDEPDHSDGTDEIFNQFLNPRIAYYKDNIAYATYYDRYAKCLKWASVTLNNDAVGVTTKYATEGIWTTTTSGRKTTTAYDSTQSGTISNNVCPFYTNGKMVVAGYDTLEASPSTNLDCGLWSAIGVDKTAGKPVIVYYDATNRNLMLATAKSDTAYPVNSNSPVYDKDGNAPAAQGNGWTRQTIGDTNLRLGQYVSLVLDAGNNLHIACFDGKGGDLYYFYGKRTAYGTYTFTQSLVDGDGSVGTWTDIKLTNESASGYAAGPVISYIDATNVKSEDGLKVAYLNATGIAKTAGDDLTLADWETATAPCKSTVEDNRVTLAVGVTDGASLNTTATSDNCKLALGYVSSRFDCVYLRNE